MQLLGIFKYGVTIDKEPDVLTLEGCEPSTTDAVGSLAEPSSSTIWPKD